MDGDGKQQGKPWVGRHESSEVVAGSNVTSLSFRGLLANSYFSSFESFDFAFVVAVICNLAPFCLDRFFLERFCSASMGVCGGDFRSRWCSLDGWRHGAPFFLKLFYFFVLVICDLQLCSPFGSVIISSFIEEDRD